MIKILYWERETCIIERGKLLSDTGDIAEIFAKVDKKVTPDQGDPDIVIGERLIHLLGEAEIVLKDYDQSKEGVVY